MSTPKQITLALFTKYEQKISTKRGWKCIFRACGCLTTESFWNKISKLCMFNAGNLYTLQKYKVDTFILILEEEKKKELEILAEACRKANRKKVDLSTRKEAKQTKLYYYNGTWSPFKPDEE